MLYYISFNMFVDWESIADLGGASPRQINATPAPSNKPLERVKVDRYMKLVRSSPSKRPIGPPSSDGEPDSSENVNAITRKAAPISSRPTVEALRRSFMMTTNVRGHSRYHCSSTAKLHTCLSSGSLPKYGTPPRIWPQLPA